MMKIVWALFEKMEIFIFTLCELPLIIRVDRKRKKRSGDICKGTQDVEFERDWSVRLVNLKLKKKRELRYLQGALDIEIGWDWSVGLGAPLGDGHTEKLNFFTVTGIFSGKAESVALLGFECTVNPQNLINFVWSHFWENRNFIFFSCELPLILTVCRKQK